jgi:hypothetical protein
VWKREEKKRTEIVELYFEKIILSSRLWNVYQIHSFLFENELSIWKKETPMAVKQENHLILVELLFEKVLYM